MWYTLKQPTVQNFGWGLVWYLPLLGNVVACKPVVEEIQFKPVVPEHFPDWPQRHPDSSLEKIELGRWLFYDTRLSIDGSRSCGICHEQVKAFSDGLIRGLGIDNTLLSLNSPSLFNIAWRTDLTWYQQFEDIESHMLIPLFIEEPMEMGMTENILEARLREYPRYFDLFGAAFPKSANPIQTENAIESIAAFTRTIISSNSRYDQWIEGSIELTSMEQQGMELLFSERLQCSVCHGGIFFDEPDASILEVNSRHGYFNIGLYNVDGEGGYSSSSQGLVEVTGNLNDRGVFRVPTLRNLDATHPWMHDGSEIDLRNIIRNYASGGRVIQTGPNAGDGRLNPYKSAIVQGFDITETEIDAVLAFLHALNDDVLLTDERYASPFCIEHRGEIINEPCEPQFQ